MNAFGGMFAGYQDPYRMAAGLPDPAGAMGMHAHHAHHMQHVHHGYKVPRIYFKIPRVLPFKEQKEKYETDDYFKKLARESEVTIFLVCVSKNLKFFNLDLITHAWSHSFLLSMRLVVCALDVDVKLT